MTTAEAFVSTVGVGILAVSVREDGEDLNI